MTNPNHTALANGVVLAELGGHGDGPYCAAHGAGGALVVLGTYIVDAGDNVSYPAHFVFKPGRANYAAYLAEHVAAARNSGAQIAVSVVSTELDDTLDFLRAAEDAGADYASYCAHSTMDMFVSRQLSSALCRRAHWPELRRWAAAVINAVDIPVIFKVGNEAAEDLPGAIDVLTNTGVPIVHVNVGSTAPDGLGLPLLAKLRDRSPMLIAGGRIRTVADARRVLNTGAAAVAIGTAAMADPELIGRIHQELRVTCC